MLLARRPCCITTVFACQREKQSYRFMKHIARLLTTAFLICAVTSAARADSVTITFEQPPCAALASGDYPGDCYVGSGMIFSSDINGGRHMAQRIAIASDARAVSPPNVARAVSGFTDVRGDFIGPGGGMPGFTDFVSWNVTGSVPSQDPWEAVIFGRSGVLASILGFSDRLVSFSRPQQDV